MEVAQTWVLRKAAEPSGILCLSYLEHIYNNIYGANITLHHKVASQYWVIL